MKEKLKEILGLESYDGEDYLLLIREHGEVIESIDFEDELDGIVEMFKELIPEERVDAWKNGYNLDMTTGFNECRAELLSKLEDPLTTKSLYERPNGNINITNDWIRSHYFSFCRTPFRL